MNRAVIIAVGLLLTQCAHTMMTVQKAILTSGEQLSRGKRAEVSTFRTDDTVVQFVSFVWSDPEQEGGVHKIAWRWFHDGQLVSQTHIARMAFRSTPWTLNTHRAAATLGRGDFSVETLVDDQVVATSRFAIE